MNENTETPIRTFICDDGFCARRDCMDCGKRWDRKDAGGDYWEDSQN